MRLRRGIPDSRPGSYILLLRLNRGCSLNVGRLGSQAFVRGWYLYVGSAFGPGGVAARCNHHRRVSQSPRWHLDYLRARAPLRAIWFVQDRQPLEHRWARLLADSADLSIPVEGFGASDCDCRSHLFYRATGPDLGHFSARLQSETCNQVCVYCEIV